MPINFPDIPTLGQIFVSDAGRSWEWDGTRWIAATNTNLDALISDGIAQVVDAAPTSLDTLNELAAALGDDANFAATVTNELGSLQTQIDAKAPLVSPNLSGAVLNGPTVVQGGYSSADTQITGLIPGSTFGGLIKGAGSGHLVIAIQDNDVNDSVSIISGGGNYAADPTFDTAVARFMSDGRVILSGPLQGGTTWISSAAALTINSTYSGKTVRLTGSTGYTFTISSGIAAGHRIDFIQDGAGQISFTAGAGVTIKSKDSKLKTAGQYSAVSLIAYSTTEYYLVGDLGA